MSEMMHQPRVSKDTGSTLDTHGSQALHACLPDALWQTFYATAGDPGQGLGFFTEQLKTMVIVQSQLPTT
jgi:hypothetical protein